MKLSEIARQLKAEHIGQVDISGVASVASAKTGELVYATDERLLSGALSSKASAIITGEFARGSDPRKPLIIAKNPKLAFARAAKVLQSGTTRPVGIDPTAIVAPEAKLAKNVFIGPLCVIAGGVIGDGTHIGAR